MRIATDMDIYNNAFELSVEIERSLRRNDVKWFMANQLRRSINSVADNIAEGCAFDSDKVMRRHCSIALGSLMEAQTQARRLIALGDFGESERHFLREMSGLQRQLTAFIKHLNSRIAR